MDTYIDSIIRECFLTAARIGGPLMVVAMLIGMLISVFQAATQVNEATLSFLPKIVAIFLTLLFMGPYFVRTMTNFSRSIFDHIIIIGGS